MPYGRWIRKTGIVLIKKWVCNVVLKCMVI